VILTFNWAYTLSPLATYIVSWALVLAAVDASCKCVERGFGARVVRSVG